MRPSFPAATLLSLALLPLVLCAPALCGQEAPSPSGPPPASTAPGPAAEDDTATTTLKENVNLVNLYFSARDRDGFITNLAKSDCSIAEDKVPQTIKNFTQEKNLPLTIGILLDTSGSQMNVLPLEQQSGATFLRNILTPKDEAFLISFDININLLADYTNRASDIQRAMNKATINTGATYGSVTGNGPPRGTLLFDAVYAAANEKLTPGSRAQDPGAADRRRRPGIAGDPEDRDRGRTEGQRHHLCHPHRRPPDAVLRRRPPMGDRDMDRLATDTGGRVINVGNNGRKLEDAFQQIQDELRTQYLASYVPTNPKADGTFRKIDLSCGKSLKVQTRKGYYAISSLDTQ